MLNEINGPKESGKDHHNDDPSEPYDLPSLDVFRVGRRCFLLHLRIVLVHVSSFFQASKMTATMTAVSTNLNA